MTKLADWWRVRWIRLDNLVWYARRLVRVVTHRSDVDEFAEWATEELDRMGQIYLSDLLTDEMAKRRRADREVEALVAGLTDEQVTAVLRQLELATVNPRDVVTAAEAILRDAA